ncbi:MAG TPA: hypothetical protein G4O18_00030 [Dehalococcoidia bacterium]|nr:hypothetical protein [Dehalococcoidia bacterium]
MEYQDATTILKNLLNKYSLEAEEKEAVRTVIGVLSWGSLSKSRLKARKDRRDKSAEW